VTSFGVITPVLTMLPRAHARWEADAGIAEVERIVVAADRLGYDHVTCSEHVAVPVDVAEVRGGRYWDPLATFGYLAARTEQIRLATYVLVVGYHHPLAIAKRYGTLDQVSGGRLILGLGVGSLEPEFDLLGAPFADRGARADDAIRAVRAAMSKRQPTYRGEHYEFGDVIVDPCARQEHVPVWIGGRTRRSLRRALELADGWAPFGLEPAQVRAWLDAEPPRAGFDVVLAPARPLDPSAEPGRAADEMGALTDAGATVVDLRFVHHSVEHCIEQLEAMQQAVQLP
jgi:probable F420-dependent oxidoreductase